MTRRERFQHLVRAQITGGQALAAAAGARVLYQAGGRRLLSASAQQAVRELSERGAARLVARTLPEIERLAASAVRPALDGERAALAFAAGTSRVLSRTAARSAAGQVLRCAGKAAGVGFVVDGAFGGAEGFVGYRRGKLSARQAVAHAGKEAATGAIASAVGVGAAAALVALTGGLAAPVLFAVGASSAILTKIGLTALLRKRR